VSAGPPDVRPVGVRALAFYLPQFHPIPENNEWWGPGFTEWTNVVSAEPRFPGHYQPHLPADLGFVDLRLAEVRLAQADMARRHGLAGFCYYHYWFAGRRLLQRPFDEVLSSGQPDFPFCLCWANEPWSRRWDGSRDDILIDQTYSADDDESHIRSLIPAFADPRYVRIDGRPLFLVYRTELLPEAERTAETWRTICAREGIGEVYLARVENFRNDIVPASIGFDAAVEYAPDFRLAGPRLQGPPAAPHDGFLLNNVLDYDVVVRNMRDSASPPFKRFRTVFPAWDDSSRRRTARATIFVNSTPEKYGCWLELTARDTVARFQGDERLLFVNAWNEWGEGCHLEPDQRYGRQFLEATQQALRTLTTGT
jgi:lipopolysaccharide biosynthesis protein